MKQENVHLPLAQIRKHIAAVVIIRIAVVVEGKKVSRSERGGRNRQSNRLIEALLAGQAHTTFFRGIDMLIAKPASTFDASAKRRILATMRHEITDNHFTFFCH
jgi:hypothetical protein